MRLRGEGHGQVHLLGPRGVASCATSLRHFIHWRHPLVQVSEVVALEPAEIYADEHVAVVALWQPPLVGSLWMAPGWLQGPKDTITTTGKSSDNDSSSTEKDASTSSSSSSSEYSESETDSTSTSSSESDTEQQAASNHAQKAATFDGLDTLFMQPGGLDRAQILSQLTITATPASKTEGTRSKKVGGRSKRPLPPPQQQQPAVPVPLVPPPTAASSRHFVPYDQPGVSIAVERKVATMTHQGTSNSSKGFSSDHNVLLAYVCHIKANDQVLLITRLRHAGDVAQLQRHPAMALLQSSTGNTR